VVFDVAANGGLEVDDGSESAPSDAPSGETGEEAFGGVGAGVAVRIIRKSPDRMAEFGESRAVLPSVGINIRRSQAAAITEGDLILIGAETYRIIGEPMGDALGLVWTCEAMSAS
jgi:hypothetical protein